MTCRRATELMTDHLEGSLSEPERTRFEAHLAGCDGCTAYLAQLRATIATLGVLADGDVAEGAMRRLIDLHRRLRGC